MRNAAQEEAEREIVATAVAETEEEIFKSAFDEEPSENNGDRSLEEMDEAEGWDSDDVDGEAEPDEEGDDAEGEEGEEGEPVGEPTEEPEPVRDDRRGIPSGRLRQEAEARRAAEAERDNARREAMEMRVRLEALERAQQRPPQPVQPQQAPERPDLFADPEGRLAYEAQRLQVEYRAQRLNDTFDDMREQHGERFQQAFNALQETRSPEIVRSIANAPNPGRALMAWHQRQSLLAEIGDDPVAYRQKVARELVDDPEVRQALMGAYRQQAVRGGNTNVRLPPSLNSATGGTSHRGEAVRSSRPQTTRSIEQDIFASAFED